MKTNKKVIKSIVTMLNKGHDTAAIAAEVGCTLKQVYYARHRLKKDRLAKTQVAERRRDVYKPTPAIPPAPKRKYTRKAKPVPTLWQRIRAVFTGEMK